MPQATEARVKGCTAAFDAVVANDPVVKTSTDSGKTRGSYL